jgi:uncharacterized membrane protein (UPF0127 family)
VAIIIFVGWLLLWQRDAAAVVQIAGVSFKVNVADTEAERQVGLSRETSLSDGNGMLFVFTHAAPWAIWMKDMKMPIDIVWLDENKTVVYVEREVKPESYPAYFVPPVGAMYVLELASGAAERTGVAVGEQAKFDVPAATK